MRFRFLTLCMVAMLLCVASAKELVRGTGSKIFKLTPNISSYLWEQNVARDLFEGLIGMDHKGNIIQGVATSWELAKDLKSITFVFNKKAKWSDGTPVTPSDFIFSYRRMLDPNIINKNVEHLFVIKNGKQVYEGKLPPEELGVRIAGNNMLKVEFEYPTPYAEQLFLNTYFYPLPKHVVEAHGSKWYNVAPVSNGGYVLESEFGVGEDIRLSKNPFYHGTVNIDKVRYTYTQSGLNMYRSGALDLIYFSPDMPLSKLKREFPGQVFNSYGLNFTYFAINKKIKKEIRKAIALAVNRDKILLALGNYGKAAYRISPPAITYGPYVTEAVVNKTPISSMSTKQKMSIARGIMKKLGYSKDKMLTLGYKDTTHSTGRKVSIVLKDMLKDIYINVKISALESRSYYGAIKKGQYDIASLFGIGDVDSPLTILDLFEEGTIADVVKFEDKEFFKLIEKGRNSSGKNRLKILAEAESRLANSFRVVPYSYFANTHLVSTNVVGFAVNDFGHNLSRLLSFKE